MLMRVSKRLILKRKFGLTTRSPSGPFAQMLNFNLQLALPILENNNRQADFDSADVFTSALSKL